jgi:hypothetical protein
MDKLVDPGAEFGVLRPGEGVNIFRVTCPLPGMLSQELTVNGAIPRSRRRRNASFTSPKLVAGTAPAARSARTAGLRSSNSPVTGWTLYPPSVTVSETIRVAGSAIFSMTASGSSGASR